jgi:hypothetical protein
MEENMKDLQIQDILSSIIPSFHEKLWNEFTRGYVFECTANHIGRYQYLNSRNIHVSFNNVGQLNNTYKEMVYE